MTDLYEIERNLPVQLRALASTVGVGQLSRSAVDRRAAKRARARRLRAVVGSGVLASLVMAGALVVADGRQDQDSRVVVGGIAESIAPAAPLPGLVEPDPPTTSPEDSTGTTEPTLEATPAPAVPTAPSPTTPLTSQPPDSTKTSPASRGLPVPGEPATNNGGGTAKGSIGTPSPAGAQEVPPPSGQLDPLPPGIDRSLVPPAVP